MTELKMCANEDMAIYILDFIKRNYEKRLNEDGQAGCQKYVEALQMGIDALSADSLQKEKIKKWKKDLEYYLDINEENGVVYIPKFVVEKRIKEMGDI